MRHGVIILPEHPAPRARRLWTRAEKLGFDHAWTYDHLVWRWLHDRPWFGSIPTLAVAAAATSRIALGTLVASPSFRHPVTLAKDFVTLDDISGGRAICGVGAGAGGFDDQLMGGAHLSPHQRQDRFAEFVELLHLLLTSPGSPYHGSYYTSDGPRMHPGCVQQPRLPIALAATGRRGMRLAARHAEIWVTAGAAGWGEPARFDRATPLLVRQMSKLDEACAEIGRDPSTLRRLVVTGAMISGVTESAGSYQDASGGLASAGFTDLVVHWPRSDFPYQGRTEVLEEIAHSAVRGREAG